MNYAVRDAVERDLDQCLALTTDRFLYDEKHLAGLRGMWSHLIASRAGVATVIVEARVPAHVVFFATFAFVADERADRYHDCSLPKIGYKLAEDWDAGRHPFFNRDEIAAANAGSGLNLVVTHHGYEAAGDEKVNEDLRAGSYECGSRCLRGWNLRSYTNEVFAENSQRDGKEMGEANGLRLGRYTTEQLREAGIPVERAPWVWLARRDDRPRGPAGMAQGMLFHSFAPPRFGLTFSEQDLLRLALDGCTDEAIAEAMGTSLSTTKKRFRTIYDKVQNASVGPGAPVAEQVITGVRGLEARRHLVNYLREHPEELHPYKASP